MALAGDEIDQNMWKKALGQVTDVGSNLWECTKADLKEIALSDGDDSLLLYPRLLYYKITEDDAVKNKIKKNVDGGIRKLMQDLGLDEK